MWRAAHARRFVCPLFTYVRGARLTQRAPPATRGFWRLTPIAPNVCRATLIQQGEVGGIIPLWVLNSRVKSALSFADEIRARSLRNGQVVDAEVRDSFILPPHIDQLDEEQTRIVDCCRAMVEVEEEEWATLPSPSPFIAMRIKYKKPKKGERSIATGEATAIIDCSAHVALAWWHLYCSRERVRLSLEVGNKARLVVSETTPHDNIVATVHTFPFPLKPRLFVARQVCTEANGVLLYCAESVENSKQVDFGER